MTKKSRRHNIPEFNFVPDGVADYNSITCLNSLCSADEIIDRMKYDSPIIFKKIQSGELDISKFLPVDEECLCNMGWGKRPYVNRYFCIGCEMIRRLTDSVKIPESKTLTILVGKYKNRHIDIKEFSGRFDPYITNEEYQALFDKFINNENTLGLMDPMFASVYKSTQMMTTESDITNYIMSCIFIANKMLKYKLPNVPIYDWAFYCRGVVKILEPESLEYSDLLKIESLRKKNKTAIAHTTLNPLTMPVVMGILKQLVYILHFMCKYSYIHGEPNIKHLRFTEKQVIVKYEGVSVESPVILHLQPSAVSSFNVYTDSGTNYRLAHKSSLYKTFDYFYPIENMDVMVNVSQGDVVVRNEVPMLPELAERLSYCYKIGSKLTDFLELSNNCGIPLLSSSFEFYCFMISLLCEDTFYSSFITSDDLMEVWKGLWQLSEYEAMMKELTDLKLEIDVAQSDIYEMLAKFTLRSDSLIYFWNSISKL